jgi:hypothetical protein
MKHTLKQLVTTTGTALLLATAQVSAFESTHTFTLDDLVGGFDGRTYGDKGNYTDETIICGLTDSCPTLLPDGSGAPQPFLDKSGTWLYPIDSEFGFYVVDFASAFQKTDDGVYTEGYAGNIVSDGQVVGLAVSNAATDTFRVPAPLGTWCSGIGGSSVKCSTEHYVVMEHVKSCHETVPYITGQDDRADPLTGVQAVLTDPDGNPLVYCEDTKLDNALTVVGGVYDEDGTLLFPEGTLIESDQILYDGTDGYLVPNESTIVNNIAATNDFSVTAKDDGKPLYRWGDLIKRPNDIRLYARMELPPEWYEEECLTANGGLGCRVNDARLYLDHLVTNNPNDQVRPEDMENEGATGRKPGYFPVASLGLIADTACFEGDGDYLPPSTLYENTLLQNLVYPYDGLDPTAGDPYAWSEDLQLGLSNGWYTTVDREPFEWAYDEDGDGAADYSSPVPLETEDTLLSGPRWRLTAQKFGQDVPGLEIPVEECSPPPYQKENIKYEVGAPITTVLDMLDWESDDERSVVDPDTGEHVSPLAFSNGWVNAAANGGAEVNDAVDVLNEEIDGISVNGLPLSSGFDLSVYVKGDKKATALYSATLVINADDPSTGDIDVEAVSLDVPGRVSAQNEIGRIRTIGFTVSNVATEATAVDVEVCGVANLVYAECFAANTGELLPGASQTFEWSWTAPTASDTLEVEWTATATAAGDQDPGNNTLTAETLVLPMR